MVLKLFILKAKRVWTNKSFTKFLDLLKQMLLEDNNLSDYCYEDKKMLCPMSFEYIKIHACHNDNILYIKEYEKLD